MKGHNGELGVTPFPTNSVATVAKAGFAQIQQKKELTALTVIYGNERFPEGSVVYVKSDACKQPWAVEVYEVEKDKKFILLPENFIKIGP